MSELCDLRDATPGKFAWDTSMYKVMRLPVSVPSQGSGSCTSSAQDEVIGDGTSTGGMSGEGGPGSTGGEEKLDWSKGRFAAFAMARYGRVQSMSSGGWSDKGPYSGRRWS